MKLKGQSDKGTSGIVGQLEDVTGTGFLWEPNRRRHQNSGRARSWKSEICNTQPRGKRNQERGFHQHNKEEPRVCSSEYKPCPQTITRAALGSLK